MSFKNFDEWINQVPSIMKTDPLWEFETYQRALFLADLAWFDGEKLDFDPRGREIARQLVRSAGSISANIEEGYGRGYGKDYARFLRIALGSARETKGWYFRGRHAFDYAVVEHRINLASQIIKSLIVTANQQRNR